MENAKWNGETQIAVDIAKDFELEKAIRIASKKGDLACPDVGCPAPILRYCRGESKAPYFAHRSNCNCDYAKFDRGNTPLIRSLKRALYDSFVAKGYNVQLEAKFLPHHYTHICFLLENGDKIAVETPGGAVHLEILEVSR